MWQKIESWADRENRIEATALSMTEWFSAGDVKVVVESGLGHEVNVSPNLARMVGDGLLVSNGKKTKGARYSVAPPKIVERSDWTD